MYPSAATISPDIPLNENKILKDEDLQHLQNSGDDSSCSKLGIAQTVIYEGTSANIQQTSSAANLTFQQNLDIDNNAFRVLQMYPELYADFDIQRRRIASEYNVICREIRLAVNNCAADLALKHNEIETRIALIRQKFQNLEQNIFERYLRKAIKDSSYSEQELKCAVRKRKKRRENFQPEQVLILRT